MRLINLKGHLPHQVFFILTLSPEGWPTKVKGSSPLGKTDPTRHQPIISMSQGKRQFLQDTKVYKCYKRV